MKHRQATVPEAVPAAGRKTAHPAPRASGAGTIWPIARRAVLLLLATGLTAGLVGLLWLPQFRVSASSTLIGGNHRLSSADIYLSSGVDGRSIFLIRPAAVEATVTQMPGIAGARVQVRLPDQITIDVREQEPLVAWQGITTTVWLAADGTEVPALGEAPPLVLNDRTGMALGDSQKVWPQLLPNLAEIHAVRPDLSALYYGKLEGLYFRAPAGWTVYLGDGGPVRTRLALLDAIEPKIAALAKPPRVVDLRFSDRQAFWY